MFPDERDKNLLKLLLYLLTINPRARIPAKQALLNPFFSEVKLALLMCFLVKISDVLCNLLLPSFSGQHKGPLIASKIDYG
jgi:hypothetical protein